MTHDRVTIKKKILPKNLKLINMNGQLYACIVNHKIIMSPAVSFTIVFMPSFP